MPKKSTAKANNKAPTPLELIKEHSTFYETYDALDDPDMASEMLGEMMGSIIGFMKAEQEVAVELTKLAATHAKELDEEKVFALFRRSVEEVRSLYQDMMPSDR